MPAANVAFTHKGVDYVALPSQGVFVGVGTYEGRPYLAYCAMMQDGSPETYEGEPNVGETINLEGRQDLLDEINGVLGSSFTLSAIEGRML